MSEADLFTLRVLAGRAKGSSAPLEHGRGVEVGYELENEIVLRDPSAKGVRFRIRPRDDAAELDIEEGQVELLGHALQAPATAILPPYVPLLVGESAIAIGHDDSPRWDEAERLLKAALREEPNADGEDSELRPTWMLTRWRGLLERAPYALPVLAIGAVAAAVLVAAGSAPNWIRPKADPAEMREQLAGAGFRNIKVAENGEGRLVLTGMLTTERERARLQSMLKAQEVDAIVRVQSGERLALTVEDVFRANGLEAKAQSLSPGVVRVQVRNAGEGEVASVQKLAAREVPGLKHLAVQRFGDAPAAPAEPAPDAASLIPAAPGKRVVSVVDGRVSYVATQDGSRYFPGAILPTGHRIVKIVGDSVVVEKSGAQVVLKF